MWFKPCRYLSLVAFAGVMLVGCNNTQPNKSAIIDSKGPPMSPQTSQRPPAFPGGNANQTPFPTQKPSPFGPSNAPNVPSQAGQPPIGQPPIVPATNSPFTQNPGSPVVPSQSFSGPPSFPPLPGQPGQVPLPTNVANTPITGNTTLFAPSQPGNVPMPSVPSAPPGFGTATPPR